MRSTRPITAVVAPWAPGRIEEVAVADLWEGVGAFARYRYEETESEVVEELATALGRSGDRLQRAIARHAALSGRPEVSRAVVADALREVGAALYALALQREATGFVHGNHAWIATAYDVPAGAWRYA